MKKMTPAYVANVNTGAVLIGVTMLAQGLKRKNTTLTVAGTAVTVWSAVVMWIANYMAVKLHDEKYDENGKLRWGKA